MTEMGAACVASAGKSLTKGLAAALTVYPVVPRPLKSILELVEI